MHNCGVEFKCLNNFKNALFDSELIKSNYLLPVHEFERIRVYETQNSLDTVDQALVSEILHPTGLIDLRTLMDIIDMFSLFPMTKMIVKNQSKEIYNILSGNKFDGATIETQDISGGSMRLLLDLLWIKLDERFLNMADTFRYFDKNYNNKVSFGEFQNALDNLRVKFQVD